MKKLIMILFLIILPVGAYGATFYVNTGSSDNTGDGTTNATSGANAAWRDLEYALEGNRLTEGDTLYVTDSDNVIENVFVDKVTAGQSIASAFVNGAGYVHVQPLSSTDVIEIQVPSNSSTTYFWTNENDSIKIEGFKFTNPNSVNTMFLRVNNGNELTVEDCAVDANNVDITNGIFYVANANGGSTLILNRVYARNFQGIGVYVRNTAAVAADELYMTSCVFDGTPNAATGVMIYFLGNNIGELYNNTFVNNSSAYSAIYLKDADTNVDIQNNHYVGASASGQGYFLRTAAAFEAHRDANPNDFTFRNNVFEAPSLSSGLPTTALTFFAYGQEMIPIDYRNLYIETGYTNYAIPSSQACGRGNSSVSPSTAISVSGTTIVRGGQSFVGATDIGALPNGAASAPSRTTTSVRIAAFGDSVLDSDVIATTFDAYANGYDIYGIGADTNVAAIGGQRAEQLFAAIDYCAVNYAPGIGVLSIGVNNLDSAEASVPSSLDGADLADMIIELMKKIEFWGMTPIFLGIPPVDSGGAVTPANAGGIGVAAINALVEAECVTQGWEHDGIYDRYQYNADWDQNAAGGGYYEDVAADVHPNNDGREAICSIIESAVFRTTGDYLADFYLANTEVDDKPLGTYRHPLTVSQFSGLTGTGLDAEGHTYSATETLTTTPDTGLAGAAGKNQLFYGVNFSKGVVIDQQYWGLKHCIISGDDDVNSNGVLVSATNSQGFYNLTIYNCVDGIEHSQNISAKNTLFEGCTNDINTTGGVATTGNNYASSDGDPKLKNPGTDFSLRSGSPCKDAGDNTVWSGAASVTDFSGRLLTNGVGTIIASGGTVDIGAYEYFQPGDDIMFFKQIGIFK